jgi:ribose transport system substrate-binding protein
MIRWRPLPTAMGLLLFATAIASVAAVRRHADPGLALPAGHPGAARYGLSTVGLSFPFAAAIAKGFADAAVKAGAEPMVLDAQGDVQKQANDIQDLVAQKVSGLAVMPLDSVVAQGWVDRATTAGIPTVAVGAMVGDPHQRDAHDVYPRLTALATQDEVEAGRSAGQLAAALLPQGRVAKIAVIEGAAGFPEVEQRRRGFVAALDAAHAHYAIVAAQPGDWTSEKGEAACQNILAAHPDIDLFFNEADDMVVGCARAVRAAGSHARLIGVGGSKLAIASIKASAVDGTVCFRPEALGALAFEALWKAAHGAATKAAFESYPIPAVSRATVGQCVGQW